MDTTEIYCKDCNNLLKNEIDVCEKCGSSEKIIHLTVTDEIKLFDQIRIKSKGNKKFLQDYIDGYESSVTYTMVHKKRIIDKIEDYYIEEIKDLDGNLIHRCEEKLSEHSGHGYAKFKRNV